VKKAGTVNQGGRGRRYTKRWVGALKFKADERYREIKGELDRGMVGTEKERKMNSFVMPSLQAQGTTIY